MKKYFSLDGRIGRMGYFLRTLVTTMISMFLFIALILARVSAEEGAGISPLLAVVVILVLLVLIWFSIATNTKRCHDLNRNGFWQLIPFYGFALLFAPGTKGANQYGEDPDMQSVIEMPAPSVAPAQGKKNVHKTGLDVWDPATIYEELKDENLGIGTSADHEELAKNVSTKFTTGNDNTQIISGQYKKGSLYD